MEIQSISGVDSTQRGTIGETRVARETERAHETERTQQTPRMPDRPAEENRGSSVDTYA